jgi:hypothetical protein
MADDIQQMIARVAREEGVPEDWMLRAAYHESKFDPKAKARTGASGLYQIMPQFLGDYGVDKETVWDPESNTRGAAKAYKRRAKKFAKHGIKATPYMHYLAHNQGMGGVYELLKAINRGAPLSKKTRRNLMGQGVMKGYQYTDDAAMARYFLEKQSARFKEHKISVPQSNDLNPEEEGAIQSIPPEIIQNNMPQDSPSQDAQPQETVGGDKEYTFMGQGKAVI